MDFQELQDKLTAFGIEHKTNIYKQAQPVRMTRIEHLLEFITNNWRYFTYRVNLAEFLDGVAEDSLTNAKIYVRGTHLTSEDCYVGGDANVEVNGSDNYDLKVMVGNMATVKACKVAFVTATDDCTVHAFKAMAVYAHDRAAVLACTSGNAPGMNVWAYNRAKVQVYGAAMAWAKDHSDIQAYGWATVRAEGHATVKTHGNALLLS